MKCEVCQNETFSAIKGATSVVCVCCGRVYTQRSGVVSYLGRICSPTVWFLGASQQTYSGSDHHYKHQ